MNQFVTSMNPEIYAKNQLYGSTHSSDRANYLAKLWACSGMLDHVRTLNNSLNLLLLWLSNHIQKSIFIPQLV